MTASVLHLPRLATVEHVAALLSLHPRPVWELIVPRASTAEDLRDLEVRIAWELRVPVDEAVTLAREVRRRMGR